MVRRRRVDAAAPPGGDSGVLTDGAPSRAHFVLDRRRASQRAPILATARHFPRPGQQPSSHLADPATTPARHRQQAAAAMRRTCPLHPLAAGGLAGTSRWWPLGGCSHHQLESCPHDMGAKPACVSTARMNGREVSDSRSTCPPAVLVRFRRLRAEPLPSTAAPHQGRGASPGRLPTPFRGCSSMAEFQPSKLAMRVRSPSPAPICAYGTVFRTGAENGAASVVFRSRESGCR